MTMAGTESSCTNLSLLDRALLLLEREGNRRFRSLGTGLYRLTGGRFAPRDREVLLLTTRGRKFGREHTVLLQSFRDGAKNMVVVAANSGRSSHPDWFYNLEATPTARVEVMDRTLRVRGEQLPAEEAAAFWARILRCVPGYARYRKAAIGRDIPLVRLVPIESGTPAVELSGAALTFRLVHAAIAVEMLLAIAYIWWCALSGRRDRLLRLAVATLLTEGVLVTANRGDCPLGGVQRRLGDPVPLFELVLSPRAAKRAVPTLGAITVVGLALLVVRGRRDGGP